MFKKFFEGKKAVFFDLDGTIIDSEPYWDSAISTVLENIGVEGIFFDVEAELERGISLEEKWLRIISGRDIKINLSIKELVKHTQNEFLNQIQDLDVTDGFWQLVYELKEVKKMKLALTTNTDREVTNSVMNRLEISEVFDFTICGDEVKNKKPDPEMYNVALKKLGLRPKEVLVFEDSIAGVKAAKKARLDVIVIWDGETDKNKYTRGILEFTSSFAAFPGNLDTTFHDELVKAAQEMEQEKSNKIS